MRLAPPLMSRERVLRRCIHLLAGAWISCAAASASQEGGRPAPAPVGGTAGGSRWEMVGKGLEGHPGLPALRRCADESLRGALDRLRSVLGAEPGGVPIRWCLDVSPAAAAAKGSPATAPFEAGRTGFVDGEVRVVIPARRFLRRPGEVGPIVAHEAAHAVLASALGDEARYARVPAWFREGMALWFSGEGAPRVRETVAHQLVRGGAARSFLVGISDRAPRDVTPAESYLAVQWLESRVGVDGLRALHAAAVHGEPVAEAIASMTGRSFRAVALLAGEASLRRIAEEVPADVERRFREALDLYRRGDRTVARTAWEDLLARAPRGALADTLRYLVARDLFRNPEGPASLRLAEGHLRRVLESPSVLWRPEALVLLGEMLQGRGATDEARASWTEVLEGYGEDSGPAGRARQLLDGVAPPPPPGA